MSRSFELRLGEVKMSQAIGVRLPKDVLNYVKGKTTISEATNQTGLTILEMEKYLIEQGFVSNYSIEDLERELKLLK